MPLRLTRDSRLLFIGASITDCDRRADAPEHLGTGYVRIVRDWLLARDPAGAPHVINRGIGGNTVADLARRWEADVIDERPDAVSIMIGVNDVWRQLDGHGPGVPLEAHVSTFRGLLERTLAALPACQLVVAEPTVIGPPAAGSEGNRMLAPYVAAQGALAREFGAVHVPTHAAFLAAQAARPDLIWAPDGVHPPAFGHALLAREWLAATGLL